jgi:hypothetical protein
VDADAVGVGGEAEEEDLRHGGADPPPAVAILLEGFGETLPLAFPLLPRRTWRVRNELILLLLDWKSKTAFRPDGPRPKIRWALSACAGSLLD